MKLFYKTVSVYDENSDLAVFGEWTEEQAIILSKAGTIFCGSYGEFLHGAAL